MLTKYGGTSVTMLFALAIVALAGLAATAPQGSGNIDEYTVQQIMSDDKLYIQYFNCVMDRGKCSPGGQTLKSNKFKLQYICIFMFLDKFY